MATQDQHAERTEDEAGNPDAEPINADDSEAIESISFHGEKEELAVYWNPDGEILFGRHRPEGSEEYTEHVPAEKIEVREGGTER